MVVCVSLLIGKAISWLIWNLVHKMCKLEMKLNFISIRIMPGFETLALLSFLKYFVIDTGGY